MNPTEENYSVLQSALDYFNHELFDGLLPPCLITLQRKKSTFGYFVPGRFVHRKSRESVDEIALNPTYFATVPIEEILQTIVHEMVHQWQYHYGKPSRSGYHNKEWAEKMESIGLMPSSTGKPGGKRTGQKMSDYIASGGKFEAACKTLLDNRFIIPWVDKRIDRQIAIQLLSGDYELEGVDTATLGIDMAELETISNENRSNREKYSCPSCGNNVWGKPGMNIECGDCHQAMKKPE